MALLVKRQRTERFLYLVGSEEPNSPLKVGVAANTEARIRTLQVGHPHKLKSFLVLELTPETVRKAESACHRLMRSNRLSGEWFAIEREEAKRILLDVVERRLWLEEHSSKPLKDGLPPARTLTGPEFAAELARLGIRRGWLAERWGVHRDTLRRWCQDGADVPAWVPDALIGLASRTA